VALEGRLLVLFELRPQRALLLRGGEVAPLASHGTFGFEIPALATALYVAFDGREGDPEETGYNPHNESRSIIYLRAYL
jgi:hypothetical protein